MEDVTRQLLAKNLNQFNSVKEATHNLGVPVSTFYRKMKKFNLSK
jgi:transcriptional regulator of acetoin/glycerol metabolism